MSDGKQPSVISTLAQAVIETLRRKSRRKFGQVTGWCAGFSAKLAK
jgi:hypothetical protein